jgi:ABC-type nitrate/sulfonate/bicarbonate transport system permease component
MTLLKLVWPYVLAVLLGVAAGTFSGQSAWYSSDATMSRAVSLFSSARSSE